MFLQQGQSAILANNVDDAIRSLNATLAVPNLPECMRSPATNLVGELTGRKKFNGLVTGVEAALAKCDSNQATQLVGQATAIQPRTDVMQAWLNETAPRILQIQENEREAMSLIGQARARRNSEKQLSDIHAQVALENQANALVREAKGKVAPCILQLDPSDDESPELSEGDINSILHPTDEFGAR